ncbi:MAG: hypothetical protein E6778_02965 [Niallia nealsonii]|nr:hypothetical protein [Niallia nealsonii]
MELFKWELYKLFRQKIIYIAFISMMAVSTGFTFYYQSDTEKAVYNEWTGPLTEERIQQAEKGEAEFAKKIAEMEEGDSLSEEDNYTSEIYNTIVYAKMIKERPEINLTEAVIDDPKKAKIAYNLIERIDDSYFSNMKGPRELIGINSIAGYAMTAALLLIGLSTIYSNEYSSGADNYLLSTRKGRKTVIWAKIFAALIYVLLLIIIFDLWMLFYYYLQFGIDGWEMAIQYYTYLSTSPYPFTFWEYHLVYLGMHILGGMGFALLIMLISMLNKNVLLTFIISAAVYILPLIIYEMVQWEWVGNLMLLSYVHMMKAEYLFVDLKFVNVFGTPIIYPIFICIFSLLVSILLIAIMFRVMQRKEVTV